MRLHRHALDSYGAVQVSTGVATANGARLVLMLFDGLLDSLSASRGHIQHGNIIEKNKSIGRASKILIGLQGTLDFERGGELAQHLSDLYAYMIRRLVHVNAQNDLNVLQEVQHIVSEIRSAWQTLPGLDGQATALNHGTVQAFSSRPSLAA